MNIYLSVRSDANARASSSDDILYRCSFSPCFWFPRFLVSLLMLLVFVFFKTLGCMSSCWQMRNCQHSLPKLVKTAPSSSTSSQLPASQIWTSCCKHAKLLAGRKRFKSVLMNPFHRTVMMCFNGH